VCCLTTAEYADRVVPHNATSLAPRSGQRTRSNIMTLVEDYAANRPVFSLTVARDRAIGVLPGTFMMWLVFERLYSRPQAMRWCEFLLAITNPITHVRQSAKRSRIPAVLSCAQLQSFLVNLTDPARTAVLLGALTSLRVGELLGLKWSDIDLSSWRSLLFATSSSSGSSAARRKPQGSRFQSMPNWRKRFGPGGFVAHTTSRMTGSLPAPQEGATALSPAHCIALRSSRHSRLQASLGRWGGTLCDTALAH
jgi:hypothetical protein